MNLSGMKFRKIQTALNTLHYLCLDSLFIALLIKFLK
jgi:hypothetical protein